MSRSYDLECDFDERFDIRLTDGFDYKLSVCYENVILSFQNIGTTLHLF